MFAEDVTTPKAREYVAPDGSTFLPAGRVFQQGPSDDTSGWRFSDNLDAYGLIGARAGQKVYVSSASEDRTYSAVVTEDGTLKDLKAFADRGGECVAADARGNVYVANGQIFVYDPAGSQIAEIDVPERPIDILFGEADRGTLFILGHHALFAVKVRGGEPSRR
jgi:sugar lactone lactonase YvrE